MTLYSTLEPCGMCAARVANLDFIRVVYLQDDPEEHYIAEINYILQGCPVPISLASEPPFGDAFVAMPKNSKNVVSDLKNKGYPVYRQLHKKFMELPNEYDYLKAAVQQNVEIYQKDNQESNKRAVEINIY